jgi:DNA modification methylase
MSKRPFKNKLNNLDPKSWLKFQKSWFVHNPPRRKANVLRHPAKFPETLAGEFIEFFTKRGQVALDPMAGTGSALVAALRAGRHSYGIELNPTYAGIARQVIAEERQELGDPAGGLVAEVITGDAVEFAQHAAAHDIPTIDYVLTSPPYWDMLHRRGAQTQRKRRASPELDVIYSDDPNDLGNIADYDRFLERLVQIYAGIKPFLRRRAYLTIIVKNVKKGGVIYPLAWDLAGQLGRVYTLKDEKIWCQDDIRGALRHGQRLGQQHLPPLLPAIPQRLRSVSPDGQREKRDNAEKHGTAVITKRRFCAEAICSITRRLLGRKGRSSQ